MERGAKRKLNFMLSRRRTIASGNLIELVQKANMMLKFFKGK